MFPRPRRSSPVSSPILCVECQSRQKWAIELRWIVESPHHRCDAIRIGFVIQKVVGIQILTLRPQRSCTQIKVPVSLGLAIPQFVANRFFSGREFLLPFRWIFTAQSRQACHFLQAPEIKSLLIDSTRWSPVTIYKGRILVIPTCLVNMCPIDQVVMVNVAHAE